jgi:predicted dehydrogenase
MIKGSINADQLFSLLYIYLKVRIEMNKNRLGVGFIGSGFVANFHIRSWVGVRHADINGIFSIDMKTAKETAAIAQNLGVGEPKIYKSITEMVQDPAIDAIWICSPNYTRIEVMEEIKEAVKSGKGELIGVACEKPLARNVAEAKRMLELVQEAGLLDGYLENQLFEPTVVRGKNIIWSRGASITGPPYLARAAEEHCGPHMPWFWEGELQGGGVLNDMMCHSVEAARFLLTPPDAGRDALIPKRVTAYTNCLKWQRPEYAKILSKNSGGKTDYLKRPAEDFARSLVEYQDKKGNTVVVETTTSWCYVGAGLRLSVELLGPEYSLSVNSLDTNLKVFFSRNVKGKTGEDLVEKQNAEMGLMPVVSDEEGEYGYTGENRYMVKCFLEGKRPSENFSDGVNVVELLMSAYMSAEQGKTISFPSPDLDSFIPAVAKGEWNPKKRS